MGIDFHKFNLDQLEKIKGEAYSLAQGLKSENAKQRAIEHLDELFMWVNNNDLSEKNMWQLREEIGKMRQALYGP